MAVPGVTLKACENEIAGYGHRAGRGRAARYEEIEVAWSRRVPQPSNVQLLSKVTQKSVPAEVCGVVTAPAPPVETARTPSVATVETSKATADKSAPSRKERWRPPRGILSRTVRFRAISMASTPFPRCATARGSRLHTPVGCNDGFTSSP